MTYSHVAFPSLRADHLLNPRLFADRESLVSALTLQDDARIAEIGVATGDFSDLLIRTFEPSTFAAFDLFDLDRHEVVWGMRTKDLLGGRSHIDFYRDRFAGLGGRLQLHVGDTAHTLPGVASESFELVYVDASHEYSAVKRDAAEAVRIASQGGIVIFNDYVMLDHHYGTPYGVVQAVNELVCASDWRVVGFALQQQLFCDIALSRAPPIWRA